MGEGGGGGGGEDREKRNNTEMAFTHSFTTLIVGSFVTKLAMANQT